MKFFRRNINAHAVESTHMPVMFSKSFSC